MTGEWRPDPEALHQLRYHDGEAWTMHVSDDGVTSIAPLRTAPSPPAPISPQFTAPPKAAPPTPLQPFRGGDPSVRGSMAGPGRRSPLLAAFAIVVAVALIAVGWFVMRPRDDKARTVSASDPIATTSLAQPIDGAPSSTTPPTAAKPRTSAKAAPAYLLTLADMPTGYSLSPSTTTTTVEATTTTKVSSNPACSADTSEMKPEQITSEAHTDFQGSSFAQGVVHQVYVTRTDSDAEKGLKTLIAWGERCKSVTERNSEGKEVTTSIAALSFPKLGDDTFAARGTVIGEIFPVAFDIVVIRAGSVLSVLGTFGVIGTDAKATEQIARAAAAKL